MIEWVNTGPDRRVEWSDRYRLTIERRITFGFFRREHLCCDLWDELLRRHQLVPIDSRPVCDDAICIIDVKAAVSLWGVGTGATIAENAMTAAGRHGNLLTVERIASATQAKATRETRNATRQALKDEGVGDRGGIGNTLVELGEGVGRTLGGITSGVLGALWPFLLVGGVLVAGYVVTRAGGVRKVAKRVTG